MVSIWALRLVSGVTCAVTILVKDVGVLARIPVGAVCAVLFDQFRTFTEPPVILGIVAAGFYGTWGCGGLVVGWKHEEKGASAFRSASAVLAYNCV